MRQEGLIHSRVTVAPGEVIFDEGDPPDFCYLIGRGAVHITKRLPGGDAELLATIQAGEFFGELGLYDSSPRSARATAAAPTHLARVSQEAFERLRHAAPLQITATLAECTIERVRQTNNRLIDELAAAGQLTRVGADLSVLTHNLRAPLATIKTAADMLARLTRDESRARVDPSRFIDIVADTADKALEQIDRLMARLRGEVVEERQLVRIDDLLRDLSVLTAGFVRGAGVKYRDDNCTYHGDVLIDRAEVLAALANLVKNAAEALPPDGGEVAVSVATEGRDIVFSVSDTGSGIPAEVIPLLFERNFSHGKAGGTGLGLSHVRAIAEKHGGRVYVESEVGRGTTVRIRLPDLLNEPAEEAAPPDFVGEAEREAEAPS